MGTSPTGEEIFRRHFGIYHYILDFYCVEEKLNIQLDGYEHFQGEGYVMNTIQDEFLRNLGIKTLRFENKLVFEGINYVLTTIKQNFDNEKIVGRNLLKSKHILLK